MTTLTPLGPDQLDDGALFDTLDRPVAPPLPSAAVQITSRYGQLAAAIAAAIVIVALLLAVSSAREDAAAARSEAIAARAAISNAEAARDASATQAQAANAAANAANRSLSDLRAVALRAQHCIDVHFDVEKVLIGGSYYSSMAAIDRLGPACSGLGPLLTGDKQA